VADFTLTYDAFDPAQEGLREALTSTGNGYFASRGAAEWEDASAVHYPGTYAHGCFNRETTILGGRPVLNEDLVNLPNWLLMKLRIEGEEAVRLDNVEVLSYRHSYNVRNAVVEREIRFRDRIGGVTALRSRRFGSMANSHLAGIEWTVTPDNGAGRVEVIASQQKVGRTRRVAHETARENDRRQLAAPLQSADNGIVSHGRNFVHERRERASIFEIAVEYPGHGRLFPCADLAGRIVPEHDRETVAF